MEIDEKLRWLETRISSSLRSRNEDLKQMFQNDENRLAFHEFVNNEDIRKLFIYIRPPRQIVASLQPPHDLQSKSVFFLKNNTGVKLTKENMDQEVMFMDCSETPLLHLHLLTKQVFLPLLCTGQVHATSYGANPDKLMDVLHRLMAAVEVSHGHTQGEIILPYPSIEVLAEAANNVNRQGAVLHVLETTVIGWIKQIRSLLKHDAILELQRQAGRYPGPLDEVQLWRNHLRKLHSINNQLDTAVAKDILRNLDEANSTYAHSFQNVRRDINKAIHDTEEILRFLSTLQILFEDLHEAMDPKTLLQLFPPLIHNVLLVWTHSRYYHQPDKFRNLLRIISNEVVHRAEAMVGEDVLREPLESYSKLKEALRVCAAFRGKYLDYRDKAESKNEANKQEHRENLGTRPHGNAIFSTRLYGPNAYTPRYGMKGQSSLEESESLLEEELTSDSPWPARNDETFDLLNAFMERCNDVLELVQTTRHFRLLADAAEIGGAGSQSLDELVKEIHLNYRDAMDMFFSRVSNVLSIDGTQAFERAFFEFRTIVKSLEAKLAQVLRQSFLQCSTINAQLRLLEVFEGISGRELVQIHLRDKDQALVRAFTGELVQVRQMFHAEKNNPPQHKNMPQVVSQLSWIYALKQRVQCPMEKMKQVSPHSLEGDLGWQLRETYSEVLEDFNKYEQEVISSWQNGITAVLTDRLKQPLLIAEDFDEDEDIRPEAVHVNLDPRLLMLLKEIHHLSQEPFNLKLPGPARELLRNTNSQELRVLATRLETIVSKYNTVMRTITEYEMPLFERQLLRIDQLLQQGLTQYTWRMEESEDFIEDATSLVCHELHQNLDLVQTNCHDIAEITVSWSNGTLDIFAARDLEKSYSMEELEEMQKQLNTEHESMVIPSGNKIHNLLQASFVAVHISEASPAWQDYVDYVDSIVLDGLKQACYTSLQKMLNQIVRSNMAQKASAQDDTVPILTIRLEMIENQPAFRPPLDESTSVTSVQEQVKEWLRGYLARGRLVSMLSGKGCYEDFIRVEEEIQQLMEQIVKLVHENTEEAKRLYELFYDYSFLWLQDVNQTFTEFLRGQISPNPLRTSSKVTSAVEHKDRAVHTASSVSRPSTVASFGSSPSLRPRSNISVIERTFLTPKTQDEPENSVPSLDEFNTEIDIYRTARDEIMSLPDHQDVGWLRVDLQPIKQVLGTLASKWMWTFSRYLSDQITHMLEDLDSFLKRIEPEIESITGEERDTASFMKMMRLFNEVSAQSAEMDSKFEVMRRTERLVKKYGHSLPDHTQKLFDAAPGRWNNLKTKVSLAKQRLGPRIQEESDRITKDLAAFGERVSSLEKGLENSDVYNRECNLGDAWVMIENFLKQLVVLENEAHDLIELQELLEASVVNFRTLPECRSNLTNLRQVWETVRVIDTQQSEWKRHRWQKMNTRFLRDETSRQLDIVRSLPETVFVWDVYMGLHESITAIQACLPLIDDLSNPAMRTRHWKQLVRVTGGALTIDNDTLKRMTLGELLSLGLQKHVDDVRAIVQRAVKDLAIERSLKTYEEVWLSKIFEMREHTRNKQYLLERSMAQEPNAQDNQSEVSQDTGSQHQGIPSRGIGRTTSRISNQSSQHTRSHRRTSLSSLPVSLQQLGEDDGQLFLLTNTDPIFEEMETHQVALQAMQSSSAAGSFLDEVTKWQRRLQTVEAVLTSWLEVQSKWQRMEEIYQTQEVRVNLGHEANIFSVVNKDFRLLMRATEKNPNVLQCCQRKGIQSILENMNINLERCTKALYRYLEKRRQKFPRFYFLSIQDVMNIVCNGYDVDQINVYISNLLENVGSLVYDPLEDHEKCNFQVVGLQSHSGEKLSFYEPVLVDGPVEGWLSSVLASTKAALQHQLATALGLEKPKSRTREIHSAGARRVSVATRDQGSANRTGRNTGDRGSRSSSRQGSRPVTRDKQVTPAQKQEEPPEGADSWTLNHVSEIVYLTTQVQMTEQITNALEELDNGNKDAFQEVLAKLEESLNAAVVMLKGLDGQREPDEKKEKEQTESEVMSQRDKGKSETMSEVLSQRGGTRASQTASHKGSTLDITDQQAQPTIMEEEGSAKEGEANSIAEPATAEPVDTMNLGDLPLVMKKEEVEEHVEPEPEQDAGEMKLLLFPSQVQKISGLIALLLYYRDLLGRILAKFEDSKTSVRHCFLWLSQLRYMFTMEGRTVQVECQYDKFEYGYEYLGSASRQVITPLTEKVFLHLSSTAKAFMGGLLTGPSSAGRTEAIQEFSRMVGRPLYMFNCTQAMDYTMLLDIFRGFALTGCWLGFNHISSLPPAVLSVFSHLLTSVLDAFRQSKRTVFLQSEEVQLNPDGACFAILDTAISVAPGNPEKLISFRSALSKLPADLLKQFRTVSMVQPDYKPRLEVLLYSQGFLHAGELAQKTTLLLDMGKRLLGTVAPIVEDTSHLTYESAANTNGTSHQTLKYMSIAAGAHLDKLLMKKLSQEGAAARAGGDIIEEEKEEEEQAEPEEGEKHEHETQEKGANPAMPQDMAEEENIAMVTALRNTFMPRLSGRDASIFAQLLRDLWPNVEVPLEFEGHPPSPSISEEPDKSASGSRMDIRTQSLCLSNKPKSFRDFLHLNTPVVPMHSAAGDRFLDAGGEMITENIESLEDAIAVATSNLGLMPGTVFQARVLQLAQLNLAHKTILVAGPAGCGKSECIKTFALAERERGKTIHVQTIYPKAMESAQLVGHFNEKTRMWMDGLLPVLLRKFCMQDGQEGYNVKAKAVMKILQLDGDLDPHQMEMIQTVLHGNASIVLANNERMVMADTLRFIWETESLSQLTPSLLANVGVLCMSTADVGWRLMLAQWVERRPDGDRDVIRDLCDTYIEAAMEFLQECTRVQLVGKPSTTGLQFKRVISQTQENTISTLCTLMEALIALYPDMSDVEYERCFNYAAIWSLAGTLDVSHREAFSTWWRETFGQHVIYPEGGTVFDFYIDNETREFSRWSTTVPAYTGTPHQGIPADAFVHTINTEQILHLLGLLTEFGKPVMLVGENGCGKTAIVNERIRTVCSGEVAEVLALSIFTNRFTNAQLLYERLNDRLEWKHGRTYVPRGNKRLLCFLDDLQLAKVDQFNQQTALELVREHIDDGGFYDIHSHSWRYVKNVTYVTTVNPATTATVPTLSHRLTRHFAVFGTPYPSNQELQSIFTTLLQTHFITPEMTSAVSMAASTAHHLGLHDEKPAQRTVQNVMRDEEAALKLMFGHVVVVTLELQKRLRTMFLPTAQRCHYIFTVRDLSTIFRNLCLSLRPGCAKETALLLWEHECASVYGSRMANDVDLDRYRQAFITAVRKQFADEEQIQLLSRKEKPIFSNLVEQDSGIVTAGNIFGDVGGNLSEDDAQTDLFRPVYGTATVAALLKSGVDEYNKAHPKIKLALYRTVIEQVCRLARILASPHEGAHSVLVAEGCPSRSSIISRLAAHLCGFTVFKIAPSMLSSTVPYSMETFKADLVAGYTRAGVKGEKLVFVLNEEELVDEDFLVHLVEFIKQGDITHLFSYEEATTIINSIRTEVTQAGLTYTRDVAWDFFLRMVKKNFRVIFIVSKGGEKFQRRCREYPNFTKSVNFIWFRHWNKRCLIEHALYHLQDVKWMDARAKENLAHMLATMHLVLRQQDGEERGAGHYNHLTNTTYEKFVERFISLADKRYTDVDDIHEKMMLLMQQIESENALAIKYKKQLEHERIVLQERKQGTTKILSQIGQDTAITEQQIKIVRTQMEKIARLKKLLPEYQVAHERAVFKAIAIVADTEKVVRNMSIESLAELRGMSKPSVEAEDLLAAIIMILKNPQADMTWQKGAKRQMANLERFVEELQAFDNQQLPESTLVLVEPYLKKPHFDPDVMQNKTNNAACGALVKWVRGVCRYHRMMISKVKPLHAKVEQMTQAVDDAEQRMRTLENKRKALEVRLADLSHSFEEATIDKNEQEEKTIKMDKMLETAGHLRRVLQKERARIQQILESRPHRIAAIPGGIGMAAGLITYLGPYHYRFRRLMLTVHWPNCLRERGIPLVIDSVDELKGRVVDWSIDALRTAPGASGLVLNFDTPEPVLGDEEEEFKESEDADNRKHSTPADEAEKEDGDEEEEEDAKEKGETEESEKDLKPDEPAVEADRESDEGGDTGRDDEENPGGLEQINEEDGEHGSLRSAEQYGSSQSDEGVPVITASQYNQYMKSLIKLLVTKDVLFDWTTQDFGIRHMENAAMLLASWQRPPLMIDPHGEGLRQLQRLNQQTDKRKLLVIDMDARADTHSIVVLEKAVMKGRPVLLQNCGDHIDSVVMPLIHHHNTVEESETNPEPRMIHFCGRRILCHPEFRLFLSTRNPSPQFSPDIASTTALVNYSVSSDTLLDDLLHRAFARMRPELFSERRLALDYLDSCKGTMLQIMNTMRSQLQLQRRAPGKGLDLMENEVEAFDDLITKRAQLYQRVTDTVAVVNKLETLRDELFMLARRGAMLFTILRSLAVVQHEYCFTLSYFLQLFDESVGETFPEGFHPDLGEHDGGDDSSDDSDEPPGPPAHPGDDVTSDEQKAGEYGDDFEEEDTGAIDAEVETSVAAAPIEETEEKPPVPVIELPEPIQLPRPGVEYSNLPEDRVRHLVDAFTTNVYFKIQKSLQEEHQLLFASLLCVKVLNENGQDFTDEEASLLLQGNPGLGMQLSLADFDCDADPPVWLPPEKFEDIIALSVLPGPLDSLCVNMAQHPDDWQKWYTSTAPELTAPPALNQSQENKEDSSGAPSFHRLLLIRILRPDRFPSAVNLYVTENIGQVLSEPPPVTFETLLAADGSSVGTLILLPSSEKQQQTVSDLQVKLSPEECFRKLAESHGASDYEVAHLGAGLEQSIFDALDVVEQGSSWLLITDLHLASNEFLRHLKLQLLRMKKQNDAQGGAGGPPRVWLTSEPVGTLLPVELLQTVHLLTHRSLEELVIPAKSEAAKEDISFEHRSLDAALHTATANVFRRVPSATWEHLKGSVDASGTVFGVGVIQGALEARQLLGTRGSVQQYPFSDVQLSQAVEVLVSLYSRQDQQRVTSDIASPRITELYCNLMCNQWDQRYVSALVKHVLYQVIDRAAGSIRLGGIDIPVPPSTTDASEYADWIEQQPVENLSVTRGLSLQEAVDREANDASSLEFMQQLDLMYEAQTTDTEDLAILQKTDLDLYRLRAIVDSVIELVPPLLELGTLSVSPSVDYTFPYHRPSVISLATVESIIMPESISFVLLQECMWMNSLLCHVRQTLHQIHSNLLGGMEAFPRHLLATIRCLADEQVPPSWIHRTCQPSTHSLRSWQTDLKLRHQQMQEWVKHQMVPLGNDKGHQVTPARGRLETVWLGGLVNPQALLTALMQEKAVLSNCYIDEITLMCDVMSSDNAFKVSSDQDVGLYVKGLYLQGASWDSENNCLSSTGPDLNAMPNVFIRPVLLSDLQGAGLDGDNRDADTMATKYDCPVFTNKARQSCSMTLLLNSPGDPDDWVMAGTALILDPGIPQDQAKKSREYALVKPLGDVTSRSTEKDMDDTFVTTEKDEEEEETESTMNQTDRSDHTQQSQLSYQRMPPNASPLPPALSMPKKEQVMIGETKTEEQYQSKESIGQQSDESQRSKVSQRSQRSLKSNGSRISQRSKGSLRGQGQSGESDGQQSYRSDNQGRQPRVSPEPLGAKTSKTDPESTDAEPETPREAEQGYQAEDREVLSDRSERSKRSDQQEEQTDFTASRRQELSNQDSERSAQGSEQGLQRTGQESPAPSNNTVSPRYGPTSPVASTDRSGREDDQVPAAARSPAASEQREAEVVSPALSDRPEYQPSSDQRLSGAASPATSTEQRTARDDQQLSGADSPAASTEQRTQRDGQRFSGAASPATSNEQRTAVDGERFSGAGSPATSTEQRTAREEKPGLQSDSDNSTARRPVETSGDEVENSDRPTQRVESPPGMRMS